jgi:hypothetical protein
VQDSLFDDSEIPARIVAGREALVRAYARRLLLRPPVASLAEGDPRREENALRFARRDIDRLFEACAAEGLTLTVTTSGAKQAATLDNEMRRRVLDMRRRVLGEEGRGPRREGNQTQGDDEP